MVIKNDTKPSSGEIKMGEVVRRVSEATGNKAVLVTDVGQNQMMASRYFKYSQPRSIVTSGGLGTMGFGIPAGMGAKIGAPERTVCLFCGDGGFQMTMQELGTIMQYNVPVKIVILNNSFLGMVRQWQQLFFNQRYSSTPMTNPDFVTIAQAFNIPAKRVEELEILKSSLEEIIAAEGPYLLEIKVENKENVFPMIAPGTGVSDIRLQ
jgi:acetolactate synthase-1/2/3 large subunit